MRQPGRQPGCRRERGASRPASAKGAVDLDAALGGEHLHQPAVDLALHGHVPVLLEGFDRLLRGRSDGSRRGHLEAELGQSALNAHRRLAVAPGFAFSAGLGGCAAREQATDGVVADRVVGVAAGHDDLARFRRRADRRDALRHVRLRGAHRRPRDHRRRCGGHGSLAEQRRRVMPFLQHEGIHHDAERHRRGHADRRNAGHAVHVEAGAPRSLLLLGGGGGGARIARGPLAGRGGVVEIVVEGGGVTHFASSSCRRRVGFGTGGPDR